MTDSRTATADPDLTATVTAERPLHYAEGADRELDRPAHVRAGSSLARVPGGIALVQDDANFIAVIDPESGLARSIALPAGTGGLRQFDDGRGNKAHKLDLEACVSFDHEGDTLLLALGSGSSARREQAALVRGWEQPRPDVRLVHLPQLYASLRRAHAFAGSELNVEGALFLGDRLRLFGRGNGAERDGVRAVNATCDLDWPALLAYLHAPDRSPPPEPVAITRYELGAIDGVPLSFTDAAMWPGGALYSAAAEDSPDAIRDGHVAGSAIGAIDAAGHTRWTILVNASGDPYRGKVEGLLPDGDRLLVVVDADDADAPSHLCTVELSGDWHA